MENHERGNKNSAIGTFHTKINIKHGVYEKFFVKKSNIRRNRISDAGTFCKKMYNKSYYYENKKEVTKYPPLALLIKNV